MKDDKPRLSHLAHTLPLFGIRRGSPAAPQAQDARKRPRESLDSLLIDPLWDPQLEAEHLDRLVHFVPRELALVEMVLSRHR